MTVPQVCIFYTTDWHCLGHKAISLLLVTNFFNFFPLGVQLRLWREKKRNRHRVKCLHYSYPIVGQSSQLGLTSEHKANGVVCVTSPYESGRQTPELWSEFCTVEVLLGLSVFARNSTKVAAFQEFGCTQKYVNVFWSKRTVWNIVYGRFSGVSVGGIPL